MMLNTDHKINILQQTNKIVVNPQPQIITKADTRETTHFFTQDDAHALVGVPPTKMGTRVILTDNSTMELEQVVHLPLALLPYATETHDFSEFQNSSLISVGQICDDDCQAILNKKYPQVLGKNKNHNSNRQAQHTRWSLGHTTDTGSSTRIGRQCHCTYEQDQKIIVPIPPCRIF